jgi:hypothetical protein
LSLEFRKLRWITSDSPVLHSHPCCEKYDSKPTQSIVFEHSAKPFEMSVRGVTTDSVRDLNRDPTTQQPNTQVQEQACLFDQWNRESMMKYCIKSLFVEFPTNLESANRLMTADPMILDQYGCFVWLSFVTGESTWCVWLDNAGFVEIGFIHGSYECTPEPIRVTYSLHIRHHETRGQVGSQFLWLLSSHHQSFSELVAVAPDEFFQGNMRVSSQTEHLSFVPSGSYDSILSVNTDSNEWKQSPWELSIQRNRVEDHLPVVFFHRLSFDWPTVQSAFPAVQELSSKWRTLQRSHIYCDICGIAACWLGHRAPE